MRACVLRLAEVLTAAAWVFMAQQFEKGDDDDFPKAADLSAEADASCAAVSAAGGLCYDVGCAGDDAAGCAAAEGV